MNYLPRKRVKLGYVIAVTVCNRPIYYEVVEKYHSSVILKSIIGEDHFISYWLNVEYKHFNFKILNMDTVQFKLSYAS